MAYDYKTCYEKHAAFYRERPWALRLLLIVNLALTLLFIFAYVALIAWGFLAQFAATDMVKIIFIPALCLFLVAVLRLVFPRRRPYCEQGANITPLLKKKSGDKQSFPSRHLASALVIAFVFMPFLTWAGCALAAFGVLLAYVRFALGVHYPSDLAAGAILGALCGLLVFLL